MEQTATESIAGIKDARPLRRVEYPEYPKPTAGMIGQQKTLQTRMKAVSVLLQASQACTTDEAVIVIGRSRCIWKS
jgi:hypothetical protein